jgi:hypothetical protein
MLSAQPAGPRPVQDRESFARRTVHGSRWSGPYRMPMRVLELLQARLNGRKNRAAAHALAGFLARMNASPKRFGKAFPVDRRVLKDHSELDLTENQIKGAIRTLEEIGFLTRVAETGPAYRITAQGPRRKPLQFAFGPDFAPRFAYLAKPRTSSPKGRRFLEDQEKREVKRESFRASAVPLGELRVTPPSPVRCKPGEDLPGLAEALKRLALNGGFAPATAA